MTLSYFSPRAYDFIRVKFGKNLPHPATIRKWYSTSTSNGEPGISKSSIDVLSNLVDELKAENDTVYATLTFDEMSIRRNVTWSESQKKFIGFINYGKTGNDNEYLPLASNAIVFMLNGINTRFNLPIAHYFINALDASEKMFLVLTIMKAITDIGVRTTVITFDGLSTNITSMEQLGANFDLDNLRPYIINPFDERKIFIMLDPPHMMKLMRNYIGSLRQMVDSSGRNIEWRFYEQLELLRENNEFVTHKITGNHINFEERKMKVSLAVQLLSNSVATSMQYLLEKGYENFQNSEGTIEFTSRLNNLFDVLNSRNSADEGFKKPICPENKEMIFDFLKNCIEYLKNLKCSTGLLIESRKKTGVKGLIIDIVTVMMLYEEYVETNVLPEIPAYLLNQDPLESLFGRIRSFPLLGYNTNPTVIQFCSALRKIVVHNEITTSVFANCVDRLDILYNSSSFLRTSRSIDELAKLNEPQNVHESETSNIDQLYVSNIIDNLDGSVDHNVTIALIASIVEAKVAIAQGLKLFEVNDKIVLSSHLIKGKCPCKSTFYICEIAFRQLDAHCKRIEFDYSKLFDSIVDGIEFEHVYQQTEFNNSKQKRDIINDIITQFIRIRATYIAKKITLEQKSDRSGSRIRKLKHFAGE